MRYIWSIGAICTGIVALFLVGIFAIGDRFFTSYTERETSETLRNEEKEEQRRISKIDTARNVNTDDFAIKALQEELLKHKYDKDSYAADLTTLLKNAPPERVVLKTWHRGETDEDIDQIERYMNKYEEESKKAESRYQTLCGKIENIKQQLKSLDTQEEEILKEETALTEKFKSIESRAEVVINAYNRVKKRHDESPVFQRPKFKKEIENNALKIRKLQQELSEVQTTLDKVQKKRYAVTHEKRAATELKSDYEDRAFNALSDEIHCEKAFSLACACLLATQEIRRLKGEILDLEKTKEDKRIDLVY